MGRTRVLVSSVPVDSSRTWIFAPPFSISLLQFKLGIARTTLGPKGGNMVSAGKGERSSKREGGCFWMLSPSLSIPSHSDLIGMNTLILDNGSWTIKGRWHRAGAQDDSAGGEEGYGILNSVSKSKSSKGVFIGDEVDSCRDHSGMVYRRPFQLGHLVNWQVQCTIWDHVFAKGPLKVCPLLQHLAPNSPDPHHLRCRSATPRKLACW